MNYEEKLLIQLCKGEKAENLNYSEIDWTNLIVQATMHKVLGLLHLRFRYDHKSPKWFRKIMEYSYYTQKDMGQREFTEYQHVLSNLEKGGVTAIVLKGMYLAPYIYKDFGIRRFHDMDILIAENEREKAISIIEKTGYVQGEYNEKKDELVLSTEDSIEESHATLQHEVGFIKVNKETAIPIVYMIELHTHMETIYDETRWNIQELFERKVQYTFNNSFAYRLSNEDMLIHLCYHNYWHTQSLQDIYERRDILLRNYMDIRLFIKNTPICWNKIFDFKSDANLWEAISYSLYYCHQIFGDVLDDNIYSRFDKAAIENNSQKIYDRWIIKKGHRKPLGKYNVTFLDRMFLKDRFELAVSCCDFSEYSKEAVAEYFYYFLHSAKTFNMDDFFPPRQNELQFYFKCLTQNF